MACKIELHIFDPHVRGTKVAQSISQKFSYVGSNDVCFDFLAAKKGEMKWGEPLNR